MNDKPEPLRVLIVDDEPLARLRLRSLVDALGEAGAPSSVTSSVASSAAASAASSAPSSGPASARVVGEAADADAALAFVRAERCDVVLLDIRMPGRDGLRLASVLKSLSPRPVVVFVTAHAEHALRAFELDAVDYLTKPVRRERLAEALARVRQRRALAGGEGAAAEGPATLVVSERGRVLQLPLAEVLVLKAGQKYVTLRTADRSYVLDESLTELEQRLGPGFIRIHRNAVVARRAIRALELRDLGEDEPAGEGWAVRVAPLDEWLAVSRRQVVAVRLALETGG